MRTSKLAWVLTLGLALTLTAGAVSLVAPSGGRTESPQTQDSEADFSAAAAAADAPPTNFVDPYPTDGSAVSLDSDPSVNPDTVVTIALAVRWGYLNDPAVAALEGRWQFNDTHTGGTFMGEWHLVNGRLSGTLSGRFTLPDDGHGRFRGQWQVTGMDVGGGLWGDWVRRNDTSGFFDGNWDTTSGRGPSGVIAGRWMQVSRDGGGFRGQMIAAPSLRPVDWDGSLSTTNGAVHLVRTIRFERDDRVLPQRDPAVLAWESTTTVNWDGILTVLRLPIADPMPTVTLETTQISFRWSMRELPGLHVYQQTDRAGHAIEVRAFLIRPPSPSPDYARFEIGLRWGNLSSNGTGQRGGDETNWNGFAQITYGGMDVFRVVSFERTDGDVVLPRDNRVTVSWLSNTDPADWDGLGLGALVPLRALDVTYFTVHAGDFTHVFTLRELLGDHVFDMGNGNSVEVRAVRL